MKSTPVEVSHHGPHHLEHDDRDQHTVDRRGRGLGVALVGDDEVVDRLEDDEHGYAEQRQRDDVVDQVFEERNQALVPAPADQTVVQRVVHAIRWGRVLIRRLGLWGRHSAAIMPDPRVLIGLAQSLLV